MLVSYAVHPTVIKYSFTNTEICQSLTELQKRVRAALPDKQKHFLVEQTLDYFRAALLNGHCALRFAGGRLAGAGMLWDYSSGCPFDGLRPGHPISTFLKQQKISRAGIISTVMVDPDCRGQGIMPSVLAELCQRSAASGHSGIVAKVAEDNIPSARCFSAAGFEIGTRGIDRHNQKPFNLWMRQAPPLSPRQG